MNHLTRIGKNLLIKKKNHYDCKNFDIISSNYDNVSDSSQSRKSKKEGKDQESIQSSTTPDPGYQWESDNVTIRHHK